jgi:glucokinase
LAVIDRISRVGKALLDDAARQYPAPPGPAPARLAVTIPGIVDEAAGRAIKAANFDWVDYPIGDMLTELIGLPVVISHDVTVGALAEYRYGAAQGAEAALVVPIGTGLAAGLIYHGAPYRGAHGRIVEVGHLELDWSDVPCGCGGVGCVERVASASAIAKRYAKLTGLEPGTDTNPDAKAIAQLVREGAPAAVRIWDDAVRALADALVTLITVLDPDRIVVGGGLSRAGETLLAPLRTALDARLTFQQAPDLVVAQLGADAGLIGAAITAGLDS